MRGSIRKVERKKGHKWRVEIYLPTGPNEDRKRKVKVFDTKSEAESWKSKMNHQINENGGYLDPSTEPLRDYFDYWLENYGEMNLRESTYQTYETMIENHIKPVLGDVPLKNLTPDHLQQFYTHKLKDGRLDGREGGLAKATVNKLHNILHKALESAIQWRMIKTNPADAVDAPSPDDTERPTLNASQVHRFLEAAEEGSTYGPIYHVALYLGLRRSELLGLRWQDVNFEDRTLSVHQTLVRTTNGDMVFDEPKSKTSRRTLRFPRQLIGRLKRHRTRQQERRINLGADWQGDDHDLVFTASNGTFIYPRNLRRNFKKILKAADLPEIPFHSLRHSTGTLLMEQGVNPRVVQSILGHSSTRITLDVYSHVSDDLQEQASQGLADVLTQGSDVAQAG